MAKLVTVIVTNKNLMDMRKSIFILSALMTFLFAGNLFAQQDQGNSVKELEKGDPIPEFVLESSVYGNLQTSDLEGKVVLVSLFATWCGPCQVELADVQKHLWPKYKDNKEFKLIVIGREHTDEELSKYNEKKGFTFPLYPDPERKAYSKFAQSTIPRAYLFGKDGKLIHSSVGYKPGDVEKILKLIDEAL